VWIGSRDAARAHTSATELSARVGREVRGADNASVVAQADVVVLSVPYSAHAATLSPLSAALEGKVLIDITVPLKPPAVTRVELPTGKAAALEAQALVPGAKVVAALHHVSATHLADVDHALDCDVLACSDDKAALAQVLTLIADLGARAFDAGALANAVALEALTPVLLHLGRKYKRPGVGIRFTGL
jgi:NADPH-dependent F420 reductase